MKKQCYATTQAEAAEIAASFIKEGCDMVTMTHIHGAEVDKYVVIGFIGESKQ